MGAVLATEVNMPRGPRLFVAGLSQHVIQRGNNRSAMFRDLTDYRFFLDLLHTSAGKFRVDLHGYVLMTNHIHVIATPSCRSALAKMMQSIGRIYVRDFNTRYGRTGSLWEGRYRSSLIQDEKYWLTCLRYVELNPVRAGLVPRPELYEWSSYRAHAFGRADALLMPHRLFMAGGMDAIERQHWWRNVCHAPIDGEMLTRIRRATQSGCALSDVHEDRVDARPVVASEAGLTRSPYSDPLL